MRAPVAFPARPGKSAPFRRGGPLHPLPKWGTFIRPKSFPRGRGAAFHASNAKPRQSRPIWDKVRRELRLGTVVLKCFRRPAKNQEIILAAFQEEGWPARIDDPLTGGDNVDRQERLHDAIKRLNKQTVHLIRFRSDGLGQGILWELMPISP